MPDYALVESEAGLTLHAADCPVARRAAVDGWPVLTMFDAERIPDDGKLNRHAECLREETP